MFLFFFFDSSALDNIATFSFSKLSLNKYTSFALCHHSYLVFLSPGLILLETFHYLLNLPFILCYILKLRKSCEIYFQKVPRILPFLITPLNYHHSYELMIQSPKNQTNLVLLLPHIVNSIDNNKSRFIKA